MRSMMTMMMTASIFFGAILIDASATPGIVTPQPPFSLQSGPVRRSKQPVEHQFFPSPARSGCTSLDDIDDNQDLNFLDKRPPPPTNPPSLFPCNTQNDAMRSKQVAGRCPTFQKTPPPPVVYGGGGVNRRFKASNFYQSSPGYSNPSYFEGGVDPMNGFLDDVGDQVWAAPPFEFDDDDDDDVVNPDCNEGFGRIKGNNACGSNNGGGGGMGNPSRAWNPPILAPRRFQGQPTGSRLLRPKTNEVCRGSQGLVVVRLLSKDNQVDMVCASIGGSPAMVSDRNKRSVDAIIKRCVNDTRKVLVGGWFGDTRWPSLVYNHQRDGIKRIKDHGDLAAVLCQL